MDGLAEVFSGEPFFRDLNDRDLQRQVCRLTKFEEYPAKSVLYHSGDKSDKYYYILNGSVFVEPDNSKSDIVTRGFLRELSSGQSFGHFALHDDAPRYVCNYRDMSGSV